MKLGDEVFRCEPFAHVVSQARHSEICDSCLVDQEQLNTQLKKCAACKFTYYCTKTCQKQSWSLHKHECKMLVAVKPNVPTDTVRLLTRIILKLRMGGDKERVTLPDGSSRSFQDLECHRTEIINDETRFGALNAFYVILQKLFGDSVPPKDAVLEIFGRVVINSFNIMNYEHQSIGIGLYLKGSVFNHSCVPNTNIAFDGPILLARVIQDTPDGLEFKDLRINYISTMKTTEERRADLQELYYFHCLCPACESPDKTMDRQMNCCLRCPDCGGPVIIDPTDKQTGEVSCQKCNSSVTGQRIQKFMFIRDQYLRQIVRNETNHPDPNELAVNFLEEMKEYFHPFDKCYTAVLTAIVEKKSMCDNDWHLFRECGKEQLVTYEAFYPKYDVNTAICLFAMASISNLLAETKAAAQYLSQAEAIFKVTHGLDHSLFRNHILPVKNDIMKWTMLERQEQ